jgi:D-alanine transaminase
MSDELLYLDGTYMPVSQGKIHVEDRGFQFGDGVYEVVKVVNGRALWLDEHLERLERSLSAIKLAGAVAGHRLGEVVPELLLRSGVRQGAVYIQVTRGVHPRDFELPPDPVPTVLAYARTVPGPSVEAIQAGEILHPMDDPRWVHCDIKAVALLAAVLAKDEARTAGAQEALFVGPDLLVREAGSSNVFAVIGGVVRTHPADRHILRGITRGRILQLARDAGYPVEERAFTLAEVTAGTAPEGADCEVFTTSTLKDIMPAVQVGKHVIGKGRPGPVTLALLGLFRREMALLAGPEPTSAST